MLKDFFVHVKYPAVAGIIGTVWIGTTLFIVIDQSLPITKMFIACLVTTAAIGVIGFRVEKSS